MYSDVAYQPVNQNDSIAIQSSSRAPDCMNEGLDLEAQTKEFLIERVLVLERQLKIRNSDCSRLLLDRHELQQRRQEQNRPPGSAERMRALEREVEDLRRRNHELSELVRELQQQQQHHQQGKSSDPLYPASQPRYSPVQGQGVGSRPSTPQKLGSRVTIFNTEMGPQVVYDSGVYLDAPMDNSYVSSPGGEYRRGGAGGGYQSTPSGMRGGGRNEEADLQARLRNM